MTEKHKKRGKNRMWKCSLSTDFRFVCVVLTLEFPGLFQWFSSTILVVPPYLFLGICHLPERHNDECQCLSFIVFLFITVLVWHFVLSVFKFNSNKQKTKNQRRKRETGCVVTTTWLRENGCVVTTTWLHIVVSFSSVFFNFLILILFHLNETRR